jgi:alkylhydroperoxidase family enzyme
MVAMQLADTSKLTGKAQELLSQFDKSMGLTPNILKQMANSPAALEAFLAAREILSNGVLSPKMRALVGILIAETYSCEYLLAARCEMARKAGISEEDLKLARRQTSTDPKEDVGLNFVRNVILRHADISPANLAEVKEAGYSDGEIVELIAQTSINLWAYYLIQIAQPALDFPKLPTAFPA